MGGRELAEQLTARQPSLKLLFTSGYTDDAVVRHGVLTAGVHFLAKPFMAKTLLTKVRQILDDEPRPLP
jgi:FixJ family two-component response regulator